MTSPENPARWAPDPLGRHQYRYWDGARWTDHVADNGVVGADPPVATPSPSSSPTEPTGASIPGYGTTPLVDSASPSRPSGHGSASSPPHLGAPVPGSGASAWTPPTAGTWSQPSPTHDPTAVLGRRYGAFFIDAAICMVVFGILFFATATTYTRAEALRLPGCYPSLDDSSEVECDDRVVVTVDDTVYESEFGLFTVLSVAFTLLYFALIEGLTGGSAGKHMVGLRVVTSEGRRPGLGRSLARWALFAIDGPLSLFLCGIITSSVSPGHRRVGDMAANTYVVTRADAGRPVPVRPR